MKKGSVIGVAFTVMLLAPHPDAQQPGVATLVPTNHPKVPRDLSLLWLAPERTRATAPAASLAIAAAIVQQANENYSKSLAVLSQPSTQQGPLGLYAAYYAGEASLKLGHDGDAKRTFQAVQARQPVGYLEEAAAIGEAEADEAEADFTSAVAVYDRMLKEKLGPLDELSLRLGRAARAGGDTTRAGEAFARVYYEFALSEFAPAAGAELQHLSYLQPIAPGNERYKLELGRAERLFGAKQYALARTAFEALAPSATGDDRELIQLRLAETDYFQKRARNARDHVRPYLDHASRQGEALFFYAIASLELGDRAEYLKTVRRIADDFPTESWAEEALDNLATYYILQDDDEQADVVFREMYDKYSKGSHAERAAWKIGWRAYRGSRYQDAIRYFEQAAHDFPRSDYRPPWLYWAGRAHEALNEQALAEERYKLETADYLNSYYGRLAVTRMHGWTPAPRVFLTSVDAAPQDDAAPVLTPAPPNAQTIRDLLSVDLFDQALRELRFAAREWGDSGSIQATIAWIERQQGRSETGSRQFDLFRGSMTTMKRAYPQFLAAGGEQLPWDVQAIIFPMAYWDTIKKYSAANGLDPFIVAALTAQESTFVPDIKSYAGAVGLMQFMPPDGREWARKVKLPFSTRLLTNADASLKMGTAYLADLVRRFDNQMYLALAAYNGGPGRVHHWVDERPGLPQDEFIDDIPYPQTQNYVKKILGTAEDYRRLYGPRAERGTEPDLDVKLTAVSIRKVMPPPAKPAPRKKTPPPKTRTARK